jgi:hypothetical protein
MLLKIPGFGKILGNPGRVFKGDVGEPRREAAREGVERDLTNKLK